MPGEQREQLLHGAQRERVRSAKFVNGLRVEKGGRGVMWRLVHERLMTESAYLALLQPQIVVELQCAAQLLGQIVWLNKLGQTCTRQHQGLWRGRGRERD